MPKQRAARAKDTRLVSSVPAPAPIFRKTKLCKFYQEGRCSRGNACIYAHGNLELAPLPDFSFTKLCSEFSRFGCCSKGVNCKYAHFKNELKQGARRKNVHQSVDEQTSVAFTSLSGSESVQGTENMIGYVMLQGIIEQFKTQMDSLQEKFAQLSKLDGDGADSSAPHFIGHHTWSRMSTEDIAKPGENFSRQSTDDSWVSKEQADQQDVIHTIAAFNVCIKNTFIGVDEPVPVLRRVASAPGNF